MNSITEDSHYDLHERIRDADPLLGLLPEAHGPAEADLTRELDSIISAAASPDLTGVPRDAHTPQVTLSRRSRGTRNGTQRRRYMIVAASVALAAAMGATPLIIDALHSEAPGDGVTAPSVPSRAPLRGASAQAAELLRKAAEITPKDPPVRPGQYWEVTTVYRQPARQGQPGREGRRIEYVAVDGSAPTVFVDSAESPGDGPPPLGAWRHDLSPNEMPASWQTPSVEFLAALPRDTTALRERVYADSEGQGSSPDGEALVFVADLLRSGMVPADLRASLFRVLETVPGIVVTDDQAVLNGRTGTAIAYLEKDLGSRTDLVIDPADGTVLGERSVVVDSPGDQVGPNPPGVVYESSTSRRLVDAVPENIRASVRCEVVEFPGRTAPPAC